MSRDELSIGDGVDASGSQDAEVARVLDVYLADLEAGRAADPARLLAEHPAIASQLRTCLEVMHLAERVADFSETADGEGDARLGPELGDYRIVRQVGRGGMGIVYEAEQQSLRRRVALKVLPLAAAIDRRQLRRFHIEAQAAAQLHHTNIVPVYAVGCERGVHYYAMQYIAGRSVAELIRELRQLEGRDAVDEAPTEIPGDDRNLAGMLASGQLAPAEKTPVPDPTTTTSEIPPSTPPPRRGTKTTPPSSSSTHKSAYFRTVANLGIQAAEAMEHAHQEGVVHRDIKPANLMVDVKGHLWITDFGLARLQNDSGLTLSGDLVGTIRYMSPEQAIGQRAVVDPRTDIYSLGVTLYEMLTLEPAFDGRDRREVLRRIIEDDPRPPRAINSAVPRELETIIQKATAKEPGSRYVTAQDLADDLRSFLEHRPIKARRPTLAERAAKWARRHRTVVASAVVILVLAASGLGIGMVLIGREHAEAVRQRDRTLHQRYVADIRQAYLLVKSGQVSEARGFLNRWRPAPGEPDVRNFAWYYLRRLCHDERRSLRGHKGDVYHAEFSPDGRTLVSCGKDGTVRFWEVATGRPLRTIAASDTEVNWVAFAPDGHTLATVSDDGAIRLWDVETLARKATIPAHKGDAIAVRFTLDGRLLSAGRDDCLVKLWDLTTLKELASVRAHEGKLESLALAPNGRRLATAGGDGYARLWNLADLSPWKSLFVQRGSVYGLAYSADGKRLATTDPGGRVRVWDLPSGDAQERLQVPADRQVSADRVDAQAVSFLAGDRMVVSADGRAILRLSDANTGTSMATLNGHTGKIWGISVSPDDTQFATVSSDGTIKLWDARLPQRWLAIPVLNHGGHFAFTPDGQTLIVTDLTGTFHEAPNGAPAYFTGANPVVIGFDPKTGAKRFDHILDRGQAIWDVYLSRDGALALCNRVDGPPTAWDIATGKPWLAIDPGAGVDVDRSRFVWAYPPGGPIERVDAATGQRYVLRGTKSSTDRVVSTPPAQSIIVQRPDELAVWDLATNQARRTRQGVRTEWGVATISPDASILAVTVHTPRTFCTVNS